MFTWMASWQHRGPRDVYPARTECEAALHRAGEMSCLGWWWKAEGIGCQSWLKLLVKRSQKYKCYQIFLLFKTFREGDGGRMAEFFAAGSFDSLRPVGRGASSRARRGIMLSGWIGISVNMCKRWFGNQHQPPDNSDWAMAPLLVDQAFVGTVSWRMLHHAACFAHPGWRFLSLDASWQWTASCFMHFISISTEFQFLV